MAQLNGNFLKIQREFVFPIIENKIAQYQGSKNLLDLGIGDITEPLAPTIKNALIQAVEEMARSPIGYGPSTGYDFLKQAILQSEYQKFGFDLGDIFISDGIQTDCVNLQELFSRNSKVGVPDPAYPAYLDASIVAGNDIVHFPCTKETEFKPHPPEKPCDFAYLCSPHNPTGIALTKEDLKQWISYAQKHSAIILFDAAYEAFISSKDVPKSIYEIPGAEEVAIEMRSFSKSAGFTGLRCGYTIFPKKLKASLQEKSHLLQPFWQNRQNAKYNGTAYIIQKAAEAALSPAGKRETSAQVQNYKASSAYLLENLRKLGYEAYGGIDSPYVWWKIPGSHSSWEFFDLLLEKCGILGIPGLGFGHHGEGYLRLSGFAGLKTAKQAIQNISNI